MKLWPIARRPALVVALAAFVALGLSDGALGTVWPDLRDGFARSNSSFGFIFAAWSGGYLAASAASGHLSDRLGLGATLRAGAMGAVTGLVVVSVAPSWWIILAGFAVLGCANGFTDATANAWVALTAGPREMGALHTAYGLGAATGPLVATVFVSGGDFWRGPFIVLLAFQVAILIGVSRHLSGFARPPSTENPDGGESPTARHPNIVAVALLFWCAIYVGAEVAVGQWSFTLLTESRGFSDFGAGATVAAYWTGLTAGRFALMLGGDRLNPIGSLTWAGVGSTAMAGWFWVDPSGTGYLSLPLLGLSFSVMFPLAVTLTPRLLGTARATRQVGYQLATASAGAIVIPTSIGVLADRRGISVAAPVVAVTVVAMVVLWELIRRAAGTQPAVVSRSVS